jgi:hypothetical protein
LIAERSLLRILKTGPPALFVEAMTDNERLFRAGCNGGRPLCAKINRHRIEDESALHERNS